MSSIPPLFRARFRSNFEAELCLDLQRRGIDLDRHYERQRIAYTVPSRQANYLPDLISLDGRLIVEIKGRFASVEERTKYIHFRDSNPHIELRFVLMKAKQKLYKGSNTLVEDWLRAKGFKVAIGAIPPEWIEELTHVERDAEGTPLPTEDRSGAVLALPKRNR